MKVFISSDIEGVCGIADWDEAHKSHPDYAALAKQMTRETAAACEGALAAGATEVWVKDGHGTGRNIDITGLPSRARLIRGWSGHPLSMMQEIEQGFDAVLMIGYHSRAGAETNPLAHTKTLHLDKVLINKRPASEFLINSMSAGMFKTPVVFISGDQGICQEAADIIPKINFVHTFQGQGGSSICRHPEKVLNEIKMQVKNALSQNISECILTLPEKYELEVRFRHVQKALKASFYPGMKRLGPFTVGMETNDFMSVLSALSFISY